MKFLLLIIFLAPALLLVSLSHHNQTTSTTILEKRSFTYCAPSFDPSKLKAGEAPIIQGLGNLHYPINSRSAKAQQYFDQGLTLIYGFNHGEAGRSFKAAISYDSTAAIAYWGLAMVLGPNYNAPLNPTSLAEINEAVRNAVKYSGHASPSGKSLISAISQRFPGKEVTDMAPYNEAYSAAMKKAHEQFPDGDNITAIYADAMMNEHPWNLWLHDGTPQPWTPVLVETLEKLLAKAPQHPGANHMYIHVMEASGSPAKALAAADRLRDMLPAAGHLVHMPSHIYIRTGDYHKGVIANEKASMADSNYVAQCKVQGTYPMMYFPHNIHFLAACAFLEGNTKKAVAAAWSVARHADTTYIHENPSIQHFSIIPYYVLTHTGNWNDILQLNKPDTSLIYPTAIWHYARGMAFTGTNDVESARRELESLQKIGGDQRLTRLLIWENNNASQLVRIAINVLSGELSSKEGVHDAAVDYLTKARNIEDSLTYQEPPDWFFSTRHTLGHILLKAKRFSEAQQVYLDDMKSYPENGWALMGLYQSLLGQGKAQEAKSVKARFDKAWKWADVKIKSSRI